MYYLTSVGNFVFPLPIHGFICIFNCVKQMLEIELINNRLSQKEISPVKFILKVHYLKCLKDRSHKRLK